MHYGSENEKTAYSNGETFALKSVGPNQVDVKVKPQEQDNTSDEVKAEGWREAWYNFSQSTTLHGVNKITEPTRFNIRRVLWLMVVLLGICLFLMQMVQSVQYYLSRPMTVNVKINYNDTLTFPAVTICNQNDFRTTATASEGLYDMLQMYYSSLGEEGPELDLSVYGDAAHIELDFLYNRTAHRKADMIISCKWDEKECSQDDFEEIFTDYGRCFSFNFKAQNSKTSDADLRTVQRTGADRGLRLILNVEQYEYMLGPNPGAGVKILIHENTEIPSVRDLGHAIPPGSHAYVGIQITQVTNLKPPHGKCNSSVQLRYYPDYSVPACVEECKTNYLENECNCRDFYMTSTDIYGPHSRGKPAPPVCTLQQFQSCVVPKLREEFYQPLPNGKDRCPCPIACKRLLFDPTISYAKTSGYDTENYKRSNLTIELQRQFLEAREVFQRVDKHEHAQNARLISALNASVWQVDEVLVSLATHVAEIKREIDELYRNIKIRTYFHNRWGIQKVKYIVHNDFARGWEVLDERTFSLVTIGYREIVAYVLHAMEELAMSADSTLRQTLKISADKDLCEKEYLCQRVFDNITTVFDAYVNTTVILTYLASPGRRYDMTWVHESVVKVEPSSETHINNFRNRAERFCRNNDALRTLLVQLADTPHGDNSSTEIIENARKAGTQMESAARSYNYWRFMLFDRTVKSSEAAADEVIERFQNVNRTMTEDYETVQLGLDDVTSFLNKLKESWELMRGLNAETIRYLRNANDTKKTTLAHIIFSENVTEAKNAVRSFFNEARIRAHDLATKLRNFELEVEKLWANMVGEPTTAAFYQKLHEDVRAAESNATVLDKLVGTLRYMSGRTEDEIREDVGILYEYMNADFPIIDIENKTQEISERFDNWTQRIDIADAMGDLDTEFFMNFDLLYDNLKTYTEGNQLNNQFFEDNFLSVDVFMKELSYEEIEQQVAYDLTSLWSDIGGSMGLFIGASIITVAEFFDVIILHFIQTHCSGQRKKPKMQNIHDI